MELIAVNDPTFQTIIFGAILIGAIILSSRPSQQVTFFSKDVTQEIKGLAILAIVLSHIGYFLVSDTRFLYPFSILAGVGVNLFLILSGFGLTISAMQKPLSPLRFYQKRLLKLYIPLWIVVGCLIGADYFILHRTYLAKEIWQSLIGFFPKADLGLNIDSPLWYFSLITFYYLVYPWVFIKRAPMVSAIILLGMGVLMLQLQLPVDKDVVKLYAVHYMTFPLGMVMAVVMAKYRIQLRKWIKYLVILLALGVFGYTAIHSKAGTGPGAEQEISIITSLAVITIFGLWRLSIKLLAIFGVYSYEIYLIHWPILSRYNLFTSLSPAMMVIANLILIVALGWGLAKVTSLIIKDEKASED